MTSQTKPLPNVFSVRNEAFIANYLCLLIGSYVRLRLIKPLYICRRAAIFVGSFFWGVCLCQATTSKVFDLYSAVPWSKVAFFLGDGRPPTFNDGIPYNGAL